MNRIDVPCIKTEQNPGKFIYSFVVDGKKIPQFAAISRIGRDDSGTLLGYQRPEIQEHINEIKAYLDRSDAILPNSIVIAFHQPLDYEELAAIGPSSSVGTLRIDLARDDKIGWLVDGQQRVAALRSVAKDHLPVSVVGFESHGPAEEREQFILVNTTKPLPKSLVYELLPSVEGHIPPKMRKRKNAYIYLEKLNLREDSPFYRRICTTTNRHLDGANIKDLSVLKMIENSLREGVLFRFQKRPEKALSLLYNYWSAVKETYSEAWGFPPKKSRLTHGVGIVSMGYLMDMIGYKLANNESAPSCEQFSAELKTLGTDIPWTEGIWDFSEHMRMPWNELQNTSRHIDLVANHLIRIYRSKGD